MHLKPFLLDVWLDQHEHHIEFDLAASTGPTWTVSEILALANNEIRGKGSDMSARFGPFEVNADRRQLLKSGVEVHLTRKAFDLLVLLVSEAPRVVHKDELHQRLWPGTFVSDATLVGLIKEVRRALNDGDPKSSLIRTVHGVGYAFAGDVERVVSTALGASRWIVTGSHRIGLGDPETIIGRDATSTVHLGVNGVSRRRARIVINGYEAVLEELASNDRTSVDDAPISVRMALHDGDRIQLGPVVVIFHASTAGLYTETIVPPAR